MYIYTVPGINYDPPLTQHVVSRTQIDAQERIHIIVKIR